MLFLYANEIFGEFWFTSDDVTLKINIAYIISQDQNIPKVNLFKAVTRFNGYKKAVLLLKNIMIFLGNKTEWLKSCQVSQTRCLAMFTNAEYDKYDEYDD